MGKLLVKQQPLQSLCREILAKPLNRSEAEIIADSLVFADLYGVHSHGVIKLKASLDRLNSKLIEPKTEIQLERDMNAVALLNANNGWGQVASVQAMDLCIEKSRTFNASFVGVKNSNHFGIGRYYTMKAAKEGMIGFACSNASNYMVPFGAKTPSIGANAFSMSVPTKNDFIITLDMSTSNVARGKIAIAQRDGKPIPNGWAITIDGEDTTDPEEAMKGYLLPLGAKGSGMAIMLDILSGILTGSNFGANIPSQFEGNEPQKLGHLFGTMNIESFIDMDKFYERIEVKVNETVSTEPMEGFDRVVMPGQQSYETYQKNSREGIPLDKAVLEELISLARTYEVDAIFIEELLSAIGGEI
ncbi:Ldh family oxidoreductase [Ureibacillus aquaedulcis]|uniref:Ldh family oxidoreductase n=1 Tax=Ureibacillus aquaedulcis TaxID=3058421 RepID=A0ABT8GQ16_9BACL|nr:Ldh family oxidoreductase [Ureibacillus sp. BA0131]MDN4493495.1 Ldh family oxidoreductase [Ureibacillus sp. BA0131]